MPIRSRRGARTPKRARESPRSNVLGPGHTWGTPKMALGASRARPSWWRLPTGARRMLRIFSQFSLPPGRATNSRLFPLRQHCSLRFRHLFQEGRSPQTEHHSDEGSASLDSPFSLLWNPCSPSPEYAALDGRRGHRSASRDWSDATRRPHRLAGHSKRGESRSRSRGVRPVCCDPPSQAFSPPGPMEQRAAFLPAGKCGAWSLARPGWQEARRACIGIRRSHGYSHRDAS